MRRKATCFAVMAIAFLLVLAVCPPGEAAINGTAHETAVGAAGLCSACHIPHGASGARLWPVAPTAGSKVGVVAQLCGSCHHSGEGYAGTMSAAFSDSYVYGTAGHGQLMGTGNNPWSTTVSVAATAFPYTDCTVNIECTSCHNVHDDANRPFLRANINVICAYCHTRRHFKNGAEASGASGAGAVGTWGANRSGDNNVGSHPVGTDVDSDRYGDASLINFPSRFKVPASATANQWSLGGHLTSGATGGVTCVTCHAVHGVQRDSDVGSGDPTDNAVPVANFLVVEQVSTAAAWTNPGNGNRSVANGVGSFNPLCESCHGRNSNGTVNQPTGYSGTYAVNPGGTGKFSHPIDDYPSSYDAGVTGFPTNWPAGGAASGGPTAGTNVSPIPICESCHVPHPLAERVATPQTARADVDNTARMFILRSAYYETTTGSTGFFCNRCHSASFSGHHPTNKTYNSTGVNYLFGTTGAAGDTLVCSTCHSSNGAHNWDVSGRIGISSTWKPANNGRDNTVAVYMYNAQTSITCMDCHYGMDGNAASKSPTMGASATVPLEGEFNTVNTSDGTHFIGLIDNVRAWRGGTYIDFFNSSAGTWRAQTSGTPNYVGAGYSRFGGSNSDGSRVLVCESCHNLKPGYNVGSGVNQHLLLAAYGDGANGNDNAAGATDSNGRDVFCEACHGVPAGTHALTGQTVSRTTLALNTTNANVPVATPDMRAARLGQATWATNQVSCDSCHQPHDANTKSWTFILDAPLDNVGTATSTSTSGLTSGNYTATYVTPRESGKGGDFSQFCNQCHLY